jgi:hypothetical protein
VARFQAQLDERLNKSIENNLKVRNLRISFSGF